MTKRNYQFLRPVSVVAILIAAIAAGPTWAGQKGPDRVEILPARLTFLKTLYRHLKAAQFDKAEKACRGSEGTAVLSDLHAVLLLRFADNQIKKARDGLKGQTISVKGMRAKVTKVDEKGVEVSSGGMTMTLKWDLLGAIRIATTLTGRRHWGNLRTAAIWTPRSIWP